MLSSWNDADARVKLVDFGCALKRYRAAGGLFLYSVDETHFTTLTCFSYDARESNARRHHSILAT